MVGGYSAIAFGVLNCFLGVSVARSISDVAGCSWPGTVLAIFCLCLVALAVGVASIALGAIRIPEDKPSAKHSTAVGVRLRTMDDRVAALYHGKK